jgi:hypothetical protein
MNAKRAQVNLHQRPAHYWWLWLFTTLAFTAIVISFGRFRSNERVARVIADGVERRRGPAAVPPPLPDAGLG